MILFSSVNKGGLSICANCLLLGLSEGNAQVEISASFFFVVVYL